MYSQPQSDQQAFNNAWDWFIVKGHSRAINEAGTCTYRGATKNDRCAIGCQLPEKLYNKAFEGEDIWMVLNEDKKVAQWFTACSKEFLLQLQSAHDEAVDGKDILRLYFIDLAESFNLTIPKES